MKVSMGNTQQSGKGSNLVDPKAGVVVASIPKPVYGDPEFTRPASASVTRFKSTVVAQFTMPVNVLGGSIESAVWGRLVSRDGTEAIEIQAGTPKGLRLGAGLDAFRDHVHEALEGWPLLDRAIADAEDRLLGRVTATKNAAGKVSKPMLVRTIKRGENPAVNGTA